MFSHIEPFAGDPILSLNEAFQADPRADKINLSIGIYFDDQGKIPLLPSVRAAELATVEAAGARPYLPMEGTAAFRKAVQELLFGASSAAVAAGRVATVQTVGSSGGLRVGADFIRRYFPDSQVALSSPTWDNHRAVFEAAGLTCTTYPYYDASTGGVDFEGMKQSLRALPPKTVVLLHACCHNPTGVDLNPSQWAEVAGILSQGQLIAFLDLAYQGYAQSIEEDAAVIRLFADQGLSFFVANSFSKSMGLYGERVGALSAVCPDAAQAVNVLGQIKATIRRNYSNPPAHGGGIVTRVLSVPALRAQWEAEVVEMRDRIRLMRQALYDQITRLCPGKDFSYFLTQRGMFSYTGLSPEQCDRLKTEFGVYIVRSGRICVAGLNTRNVNRVAEAMAAVIGE